MKRTRKTLCSVQRRPHADGNTILYEIFIVWSYLFYRLEEQLAGQRKLAGLINTLETFRAGHEELADWMFSKRLMTT